jgi:hypothetical protein
MNFTLKDWIELALSSVFAFVVFGSISSKAAIHAGMAWSWRFHS